MAILDCAVDLEESVVEEPEPPNLEDATFPNSDATIYPLHAITTTKLSEMMRLRGSIGDVPIDIFINYGAVMNFLNPDVVARLGTPISPAGSLRFTAASCHLLTPSGLAQNLTVIVQGYSFTDSFLLLPVAGCDLVLRAQWLEILGFIRWHFRDKNMVFTVDGHKHVLRGTAADPNSEINASSIFDLIPREHLEPHPPLLPILDS